MYRFRVFPQSSARYGWERTTVAMKMTHQKLPETATPSALLMSEIAAPFGAPQIMSDCVVRQLAADLCFCDRRAIVPFMAGAGSASRGGAGTKSECRWDSSKE